MTSHPESPRRPRLRARLLLAALLALNLSGCCALFCAQDLLK